MNQGQSTSRRTEIALCAVAAVAGGLLYGRFFADTGYLLPVCAAALTGAAAAAVAGLRRWGTLRTMLVAVGGFVLLASYGVFRDTLEFGLPSGRTASELVRGVSGGWTRMLTVAPPADLSADLLTTPVLITWTAAFMATTLVLRTRTVLAPAAPALAAFVAALLFAGRQPYVQVTATAVLLVATLSLVLLRTNQVGDSRRHRRVMTSRLAFGGPVIAVVAALGVLGGLFLPLASGEQRFDPRTLLTPPLRVTDTLTPLAGLKRQLREEPPSRLFTVRISGNTRVDRIRVAALDEFDGVLWTSKDRFLVAGHELAGDPALTRSRTVSARIAIEDLAGPFLPAVGWPARFDTVRNVRNPVGFSTTSGVLVSSERTLRGIAYDIEGEVGDRDDGLLRASPSTTPEYRGYTTLPDDLPPLLTATAQQLTATETTPYRKLVAIEEHLRGLPYQLDAQPGHSSAALVRLLTGNGEGYAEQHASAFAVLARAAGFPARVAVGYRLGDSPTGSYAVTTRDAHAWAEVHFEDYGWVAFEPTDPPTDSDGPQDTPAAGPRPPSPPAGTLPPAAQRPDTPVRSGGGRDGVLRDAALVAAGLAAAVTLAATAILTTKTRRRRRRRLAPGNAARVVGAWREATDRLIERGMPVPVSLTAREAADRATSLLGATAAALVGLAPMATAAVYAPDEPDDAAVEQAWRLEAQLRAQLYPRRLSLRRLRAALDPRPLVAGFSWGNR